MESVNRSASNASRAGEPGDIRPVWISQLRVSVPTGSSETTKNSSAVASSVSPTAMRRCW